MPHRSPNEYAHAYGGQQCNIDGNHETIEVSSLRELMESVIDHVPDGAFHSLWGVVSVLYEIKKGHHGKHYGAMIWMVDTKKDVKEGRVGALLNQNWKPCGDGRDPNIPTDAVGHEIRPGSGKARDYIIKVATSVECHDGNIGFNKDGCLIMNRSSGPSSMADIGLKDLNGWGSRSKDTLKIATVLQGCGATLSETNTKSIIVYTPGRSWTLP